MTSSAPGPTISEDWSTNRICVLPIAEVTTRSLNEMSAPTYKVRVASPGGVPVTSGLTAAAVPTRAATAPCGASATSATVVSHSDDRKLLPIIEHLPQNAIASAARRAQKTASAPSVNDQLSYR